MPRADLGCRDSRSGGETVREVLRPARHRRAHPAGPPVAHEKLDGSLGILYPLDAGWAVATRGSFDSDQARWATSFLRRRHPRLTVPPGVTPLVEIVYQENRIVVDHGRDELVLLGAIDIATGADVPLWEIDWWDGPVADQHVVGSAHDGYLLATGNDFAEREGLVLTWYRADQPSLRVKVKHPRYVELHRIVTGATERDIWRSLVATDWRSRVSAKTIARVLNISPDVVATLPSLDQMLAPVPADVAARFRAVESRLRADHQAVIARVNELWKTRPNGNRRAFATWATSTGLAHLLFTRLDARPWQLEAWALARPAAVPVAATTSDDEE